MFPARRHRFHNAFFFLIRYLMVMTVKCRVVEIHLLKYNVRLYLLLFPWPTPAPALRLRRWLGGARLGRRLFGPTVTHACVCPPASKSVGIKAWRSGLGGLKSRRPEYQELKKMKEIATFECNHFKELRIINYIIPLQFRFIFLHNCHSEFKSVLNALLKRITENHTGLFSKSKRGNRSYISLGTRFIGTQTGVWQTQGNMRVVSSD